MFWTRADLFWLSLLKVVLIATVLMIMSVAPAGAGSAKSKKADDHGSEKAAEEAVAPLDPHLVFMPALVVPVVEQGKLLHYFYVGIQLRVEKLGKVPEVKEHVPLIQDAFIRYVHKHPLNAYEGEGHVDKGALSSALMPQVRNIIGADLVEEVVIENVVRSVI